MKAHGNSDKKTYQEREGAKLYKLGNKLSQSIGEDQSTAESLVQNPIFLITKLKKKK